MRLITRVVRSHILIKFSDHLNLINDQLWRICNNKIFPGQNLLSILFNPWEQKLLSNPVLLINFNQAAQGGLKNVTIVVVDPPLV